MTPIITATKTVHEIPIIRERSILIFSEKDIEKSTGNGLVLKTPTKRSKL